MAAGDGGEAAATADRARPSAKSPTAFRTISEVSAELDVPQHVLRFWETKFPTIRPLKRGGGRRYYRPDDVELLRRIQVLLYKEGYTIKGVQRLLRPGSAGRAGASSTDHALTDHSATAEPEAAEDNWVESAAPAPEPAPVRGEEKRRIIGLFDHDPEADPEWARTPPPEPEPSMAPTAEAAPHRRADRGLSPSKREALGQVLGDLEEIRDLLRRVL
ncbi:MAG: MerR family transcriptional regulator [Azospirillaceae bacterium]|nr:MerR family transcriptional regulator [Azospirillaceae bacterium]